MSFCKLDSGIVNSSIWSENLATRILWITILAMSDENGFVPTSIPGLIRAANIPKEDFIIGIKALESPDGYSRTSDYDGRRIKKIEGGWLILNFKKYRERSDIAREKTRERVRKYRDKIKSVTLGNVTETLPSVSASVSASVSVFNEFWKLYPKKRDKGHALKAWNKIKKPVETLEKIKSALKWQCGSADWIKESGQYVPLPATYLNGMRWEDEPDSATNTLDTDSRRLMQ